MAKRCVRQRCTECRGWYVPDARCGERQRVCGEDCRRKRRRRAARVRRGRELERHREAERERQGACRARRGAASGGARAGPSKGVTAEAARDASRAGLVVDALEMPQEILLAVDRAVSLSRASLMRDLPRILRSRAEILGHQST